MTAYDDVFLPIFGLACAIGLVVSIVAANKSGFVVPLVWLASGVLAFWTGLFLAIGMGYRAWQSIPDPPAEAFADTAPIGALLVGWLPGTMFCGLIFGLTRLALRWLGGESAYAHDANRESSTVVSRSE